MAWLGALKNPPAAYRPVPFWSWNDRLEEGELRAQIRAMHDAGMGGFFMHARGGLQTPYLGDEWFALVAACAEEADRLGMHPWAYDENGWPSGAGDGRAPALGLRYQQKYLRREELAPGDAVDPDRFIALAAGGAVFADAAARPIAPASAVRFYYDVNPFYVDTLDAEATRAFLELVYDAYAKRLDARSWRRLRGFFTDEPQMSLNGIPWSFILPEEYHRAYGEELLPRLDELFVETGRYRRTRHRFWKLATRLFMNHFMKPLHDWCEARGLQVTGHHVREETYGSQLTSNGAVMPQYQYYHIPGIDWLGRRVRPATTALQLLSAGAQLGRRQLLAEIFACCGWDARFSDLKWMAQYKMVHGVNWICQHLQGYTLRGIRKRDYPASLFRHQPWWDRYRAFNDYLARLGVLLREGDVHADILILHGQTSAWGHYNGGDGQTIDRLWDAFNRLTDRLDAAHVAFHYGDDTLIDQHGAADGGHFLVGKQRYRVVVVPPLDDLGRKTAELLEEFAAQGGTVLAVENRIAPGPIRVDGEPDARFDALAKRFAWFADEDALAADIRRHAEVVPVAAPGVPAAEADRFERQLGEISIARRRFADFDGKPADAYYFTNNELEKGFDAEIHLPAGNIRRFDPSTGDLAPAHFRVEGGRAVTPHYFAGAGDLVLVRADGSPAPAAAPEFFRVAPAALAEGARVKPLNGLFAIREMTPNLLTLDYCDCYFDGERKFADGYVLDIQDMACALRRPVDIRLDFRFGVADDFRPGRDLFLVMEIPEKFGVRVNERAAPMVDRGFLFDPAFRKIAIGDFLRPGENVVTLTTRFGQSEAVYAILDTLKTLEGVRAHRNKMSYDMEIEAIYLAGDFAIHPEGPMETLEREALRFRKQRFTLAPPAADVDPADMARRGFPFFSGRITLAADVELADDEARPGFLVWDRQKAAAAAVRVNGRESPATLWPPYIVPVENLRAGKNRLEIELAGSLRNMLGPHHLADGESHSVGPESFYRVPGTFRWQGKGDVLPQWDDGYCVKEFGLEALRLLWPAP